MLSDVAKVIYHSRSPQFKTPVGPAKAGETLTLRLLLARNLAVQSAKLVLLYDKDGGRAEYDMTPSETKAETDDYLWYTATVQVKDTGLYWYGFEVWTEAGHHHIGKGAQDSRGVLLDEPSMWQQTVYDRKYPVPEWIQGGVFYHIFVDRFCHSGAYLDMEGKITRRDWGGQPEYRPDENGRIWNNDFFGGNLAGIEEKLPYLQSLGVTCLYLSPLFSAYSNHKYDTANYLEIDPMFGTEADFTRLCQKAGEVGIRIICDGVFSHTGSDSIYFDREGRYGDQGAYGHPDSPYRSWYYFHLGEAYETWWGIETLPRINKTDPSYEAFICGEDGVARHWLRAGAAGWRLDVADELPNAFLEDLSAAVHREKPDALLLGEVWEDASNKVAYSERKNYFEGDKLDSVMNYPFRTGIIDYVRTGNALGLSQTVEQILENYPPEVVHCTMNILGTHDTARILTALGGEDLSGSPREVQAQTHMDSQTRARAIQMLKIACVLQMTLPGVPCIYYGDEAGTEGYADPFNRTCFPWGTEDQEVLQWYRRIIAFRRSHSVYRTGDYVTRAAIGGIYAFERCQGQERIITCANCGTAEEALMLHGTWQDALTGEIYSGNSMVFPGQVLLLTEA